MYYAKSNKTGGIVNGKAYVYDFSQGISTSKDKKLTPVYAAVSSFNTQFKSGALTDGYGICACDFKDKVLPEFLIENVTPKKIYYYKRYDENVGLYVDYLLVYADDGNIYKAVLGQDESFVLVEDLSFSSTPYAVNYTYNGSDVIIFSVEKQLKIYDGIKVTQITDAPSVTSMCIHNERLFVTEGGQKTSLWFSDDFNPLNWNVSLEDAGYIDLRDGRGSLLKVISFDGYLYVFRNYGITRITAYGDQTGFSVDGITASASGIIPESIAVCGDRIIYLTSEGFYAFSGGSPIKILTNLDGIINDIDVSTAKGVYYKGNYYCLFTLKREDGETFSSLLTYKISSGDFTLSKDLPIKDFTLMEGENFFKLLFLCEDKKVLGEISDNCEYFNEILTKSWQSGESDFNIRKEKRLTKLYINSQTPLYVTVKSEKESRRLYFFGGITRECQPVGIRGEYFSFYIECDQPNCNVSHLCAEFEYERG